WGRGGGAGAPPPPRGISAEPRPPPRASAVPANWTLRHANVSSMEEEELTRIEPPFPDLPRSSPRSFLTRRSPRTRYVSCSTTTAEGVMYYGLRAVILLIIIILIVTGRI